MLVLSRIALTAVLTAALIGIGPQARVARAELLSTAAALEAQASPAAEAARERVRSWLARDEVASQLEALGVPLQEAQARVAMLPDADLFMLDGRIAELPAGGDSFFGVVAAIFVILLLLLFITDLLGWTDVFPFIDPLPEGRRR